MKPLKLRNRHTEAKKDFLKLPGGRGAGRNLGSLASCFQIQIKEQNYQINNCQIYFLYDLKLIARRFSGIDNQMLEDCFGFYFYFFVCGR